MVYNYYQTLRVQRTASTEEIEDAYKDLAEQYYRTKDHWVGASVAFRKAAEAYEILSDPQKREVFDGLWDWEEGRLLRGRRNFPWSYDGDGMETYEKVFGRGDASPQACNVNPPVQNGSTNNHVFQPIQNQNDGNVNQINTSSNVRQFNAISAQNIHHVVRNRAASQNVILLNQNNTRNGRNINYNSGNNINSRYSYAHAHTGDVVHHQFCNLDCKTIAVLLILFIVGYLLWMWIQKVGLINFFIMYCLAHGIAIDAKQAGGIFIVGWIICAFVS